MSLAGRFRRHADALVRDDRSPLSAALMYAAANDLDAGGSTAELFANVSTPPGSVPQLRLLAALHHLVLAGRAPELARFYPSAGGEREPVGVWPVALATIAEHFAWIEQRLSRTVQTNEPGRSSALFAALIWLADRHRLPIRLLEIGASAGLNLIPDRYCYVVAGAEVGDPSSPVRFEEPWQPGPPLNPAGAARHLEIVARAGCDIAPLDPRIAEDRLTLLSYIWPDEMERVRRIVAAVDVAARSRTPIAARPASAWLPEVLGERRPRELTVIWQSIVRQYVEPGEWAAIDEAIRYAARADTPVTWLTMEPSDDHLARMRLLCRTEPDGEECVLASCGDHGPPVIWCCGDTSRR